MNAPKILVIGDQGQVAWELKRTLASLGHVIAAGRASAHAVDLAQPETITQLVDAVKPQWIINAGAYTAVDRAEQEQALAEQINAAAPGVLAESAARHGALLVHYSTDYVFDGTKTEPYLESDIPNPQSVYGRSKLGGEQAIQAVVYPHLILRTSWVYGTRGHNFLRTVRRLAREREELRIVADQRGCPTWSRHIAEATAQILAQLGTARARWETTSGIYNLVSTGEGTWFDFASRIVDHQRRHESVKAERIVPIATEDYPLPAPRPRYSVLDTGKANAVFGICMPYWDTALTQALEELTQEKI